MSIRSLLRGPSEFNDPKRQRIERHAVAEQLRKGMKPLVKKVAYYTEKVLQRKDVLACRWAPFWLPFVALALVAYTGDVAGLTWTSQLTWPATPRLTRVAYAATIVTCLTGGLHFGFTLMHDLEKTRRTLLRHAFLAIPFGAVALACAVLLYSMRLFPDGFVAAIEPVTWLLPVFMNICAPVAAASLSSLAHFYGLPQYYVWRKTRAEENLETVTEFLATAPIARPVDSVQAGPSPTTPAPQPPKGNGSDSRNPLKVIGSIFLAVSPLLWSCAREPHPAPVPEVTVAAQPRVVCRADGDETVTVSREGFRQATGRMVEYLPQWLAQRGCTELRVGLFAGDGAWREDIERLSVPAPPQSLCSEVQTNEAEHKGEPQTFHELLKRDLRRQKTEERPECLSSDEKSRVYKAQLRKLQEAVLQALTFSDHEVTRQGTTDIYGVLVAANYGDVAGHLVVTDGLDNGHHDLPPLKVRDGYRPEFVIVPVEPGHSWASPARVHERLAAFQAAVPNLAIHYYDSISAETWRATQ